MCRSIREWPETGANARPKRLLRRFFPGRRRKSIVHFYRICVKNLVDLCREMIYKKFIIFFFKPLANPYCMVYNHSCVTAQDMR